MEKINHGAAQRWWRTLADDLSVEQAQASLDEFSTVRGDTRLRPTTTDRRASVATVAAAEPLRPVPPVAYPAVLVESRQVSRQGMVAYRGNRYSVPPELVRTTVTVSHRVGADHLDIATHTGNRTTHDGTGVVVARHRIAADGAGIDVRDHGHVVAMDHAAMAAVSAGGSGRPHRRKERIPPGPAARTAAAVLHGPPTNTPVTTVTDLSAYETAAQNRTTLP